MKIKIKKNPLLTEEEKHELCEVCKKFYNVPSCDVCNISCWRRNNVDSILRQDEDENDVPNDALAEYAYEGYRKGPQYEMWEEYTALELDKAKNNGTFRQPNMDNISGYDGIFRDRIVELLLRWLDIPCRPRLLVQRQLLDTYIKLGYELEYLDDRCNNEH